MFHRNKILSRRGASSNTPYPPPRAPWYCDYQHGEPVAANSFNVLNIVELPPYTWQPAPPVFAALPPPPAGVNHGRKRHYNEHSARAVKRQRLNPSPTSSPTWIPHSNLAVGEPSTFAPVGSERFHSSPPNTEVLTEPQNLTSLRVFVKDKLSGQMVDLFEACQQQTSDLDRKEACRARLQVDIQKQFPESRLYLTGSSMSGLGCRSSDADLCLVVTGNRRPHPMDVLRQLQRDFRSLSYLVRIQLIKAKVPILKFKERGSFLEFDLNVNNTVGIRNTFLLRTYAYADVRVRPLILVVKKWARHHQINDASKGTLSSYTLVLMVLHYLQTLEQPVLPSFQKTHPECFDPLMDIDEVPDGPRHVRPYTSTNQSSLGELLLGFLRYYATRFSWDKQVISVRQATILPKTNSKEWRNKFICVEEPFEGSNVARAVHEKIKFDAIKKCFSESYQMLNERKDLASILALRAIINEELARR
ncbi:PREDICTED: poly(A) RNA polymerase GLD2 isoform X1 [Poecilia mexicana]|uniref:polynucleotide adenylyltransferase n=1 Tax=Poecilia mexicana TaxID=48701 RepID=A0A3B3YY06_9TELE|nr:PREDICTED: poly(A) RNA polymerase GLD2 isoform X1 [Poecilia mexicana]XP_014848344.1 PREDICTED: poly(A) RNA polymerase GLD2 isoform X1 [Poecilia mexicana]XP_014848345.1 PREDICTED: poly(A) RNA polymerase GLD2 isoform X1 [Poecilia mexicana]